MTTEKKEQPGKVTQTLVKKKMQSEAFYEKNSKWFISLKNIFLILAGNALVAYSFQGFVRANGFLSGGIYGISGITTHFLPVLGFSTAVFIYSLPCLILGWFTLERRFVAFTSFSILLQILFLNVFQGIVIYNNDPLLASVFAGVLLGLGDGLVLRSGSGSAGIHLVAMVLKKRLGLSVSTIATSINLTIVALSATIFGLEKGLYTLILIFIAGRAMSMVLDGISRKRTAFIVTVKGEEIGAELLKFLNRGVTMMPGVGLYSMNETKVLLCVVNMLEVGRLKEIVRKLDKNAFITIYETSEVAGRFMKNNAIVDKDVSY